jgi:hypothetical protein
MWYRSWQRTQLYSKRGIRAILHPYYEIVQENKEKS